MNLSEFLNQMNSGALITAGSEAHLFMHQASQDAMVLTTKLNNAYHEPGTVRLIFSQLIGKKVDASFGLFPPFYTDCGKNITIGKNVFINSGCRFQDQGGIFIGSGTLIGHNVVIATLNHREDAAHRSDLIPAPVRIGERVWVGANATILSGVTIGEGAIVAAGAVVTKDVAPLTVVGGVPARFLKKVKGGQENA